MYNWQLENWPEFTFSVGGLQEIAIAFAKESGLVNGLMLGLNEQTKQETLLEILVSEAIKTSEIEGEYLSREDVMSSIKNNLGIDHKPLVKDKRALGVSKLMTEVYNNFDQPLTNELLQNWHRSLMSYDVNINAGAWRSDLAPMQIISGHYGKVEIQFEAPPSVEVDKEMRRFITWYQEPNYQLNDPVSAALLKSAIAHLYFESIHPFEDGNGRIGRALAEFTLSQSLQMQVSLSLSKTIEKNKKLYYEALKSGQSSLAISDWVLYFAGVILDAQIDAKEMVQFTLRKAKFFDKYAQLLNDRQSKAINRMLENGTSGFTGGMTAKKYMAITKTSKATATRDLQQLQELGALLQKGEGRSVSYDILM